MKRVLCLLLVFICGLCGCSSVEEKPPAKEKGQRYVKGIWFTYSEIDALLASDNFKEEFSKAIDNCCALGITDTFIHVRAFGDSLYPSEYFPLRSNAQIYDFDVFEYMVSVCKKKGVRVHAWINPYRIRVGDTDKSTLPANGTVYGWLNDQDTENDINVVLQNGIYLNPASAQSRKLIIDGVREVLLKYQIDGIHFDDYFYPSTSPNFDKASYERYVSGTQNPLSLEDWRRANVNTLIGGCYTAIKFIDKDKIFSISPAASVERNYSEYYADIAAWIGSNCVDWIIPQLYFGFEYPAPEYRFEELLGSWKKLLAKHKNTRLIIGLAAYKVGTDQEPDNKEWGAQDDILMRQAKLCLEDSAVSGHIFFSYSSLFSGKEANKRARELLIS